MATHSPTGAAKATVWVTTGGADTRRRTIGAATPAMTTPHAVALMALDRRTRRQYRSPARRPATLRAAGATAPPRGRRRLRDQRADQRARRVGLGVPLHAESEAPPGQLDRLGQRVELRPAAHAQALADAVDPLMVVGLGGVHAIAGHPRGERPLLEHDVVVGAVEGARHAPVLVMAVALGQMLVQRAAERDVHHLHPAADGEHGQIAFDGRTQERDLKAIALGHGADGLRVGLLAVGGRVQVGPAGQDQAVEAVEQLVRRALERRDPVARAAPGRRRPARPRRSCAEGARPPGPTRSSERAPARCTGR